MTDSSEVQALEKISYEVGDSQIKITLSSQCLKAQAFLVDKLRKQSERQREVCSFMYSSNLKLQTEIKQAELEIKSLIIAHATIKSSNVELKKELLLSKERRFEIEERITNGERKYENLWLQAKSRYESIPYVAKLLQTQNKASLFKENIIELENNAEHLIKDINKKKQYLAVLDRKRIIDLADYLINILPNGIKKIDEFTKAINKTSSEIDDLKQGDQVFGIHSEIKSPSTTQHQKEMHLEEDMRTDVFGDGWFNIYKNDNVQSIMVVPKIQFVNSDFDILSAKLDKIKIKKSELTTAAPIKRIGSYELNSDSKRLKTDDEFSVYFQNTNINKNIDADQNGSYSNRRLINILQDVKLDYKEASELVSKINPNDLKDVDKIGVTTNEENQHEKLVDKTEDIAIEEIDLTNRSGNILNPPTPFLDMEQDDNYNGTQPQVEVIVHMSMSGASPGTQSQSLKETNKKKKVSFDTPLSTQESTNNNDKLDVTIEDNEANKSVDSQLNISLKSDESFSKMKDMILKKHNLDLSPQFVYAKNNILQKNTESTTSIFFQRKSEIAQKEPKEYDHPTKGIIVNEAVGENKDTDHVVVSSPKKDIIQKEKSVTGFLFNHGTQGIPDSLNVSISTTGYEDGDPDFPHCIDASLLLSPKADVAIAGDNQEVTSQEVPNFLTGLRKTGFSFFGGKPESKPGTSNENQENNFNFNFGPDKKGRGGLFSMFR